MQKLSKKKIEIYRNLFQGRNDVFAIRWEKSDKSKSGFSPVCSNEWKNTLCLKLNRGKCKDCKNAKYIPLSDYFLEQHLRGLKILGIYPLLTDNSSYLVVADFDGKNWMHDSLNFIQKCDTYNLPAYLERSRSGNGAHV